MPWGPRREQNESFSEEKVSDQSAISSRRRTTTSCEAGTPMRTPRGTRSPRRWHQGAGNNRQQQGVGSGFSHVDVRGGPGTRNPGVFRLGSRQPELQRDSPRIAVTNSMLIKTPRSPPGSLYYRRGVGRRGVIPHGWCVAAGCCWQHAQYSTWVIVQSTTTRCGSRSRAGKFMSAIDRCDRYAESAEIKRGKYKPARAEHTVSRAV